MLPMLERDTPAVRAAAATALARVDAAVAVPALSRALHDPDAWVRYFALRSLGAIGEASAFRGVLECLEHDRAGQVRLAAIEALGRLDQADTLGALAPLTDATDQDVARAAIRAIGHSSAPEAGTLLESLLRADQPWRRLEAVIALATWGGTHAVPALQWAAAADRAADVAAAAIDALTRLAGGARDDAARPVRALTALLVEERCREQVLAGLASLPRRSTALVAEGLRHASPEVRRGIVEALGRMKDADASRALAAALDDPEPSVRAAAVTELRRLGSRSAERRLLMMARSDPDQTVRQAAMLAVTQTHASGHGSRYGEVR
jgi:HEAT repeat protein